MVTQSALRQREELQATALARCATVRPAQKFWAGM
jgi:hypothetical protein